MADIMKRWDGSQWVPITDVSRSVIERVVEVVGRGIAILDVVIDIDYNGENCTFSLYPLEE